MSENNSGAQVQQSENRNGEQNKDKRQRFDPSKQDVGRRPRSQNHRRRNNGQRQGGYDNKKRDNGDAQAEEKNQGQGRNFDRQNNRNKNNRFKRDQNQGGEKKQFDANSKPKNKRAREFGSAEEVAKNVKKVETIEDIRSDNARITKEIYLEIASLKNINLN